MKQKAEDLAFDIAFFEGVYRNIRDYPEALEILGGLYTRVGRIDDGLRIDRRLVRLCPENATARYNLACSLCLRGRLADAMRALSAAIKLGYDDARWMQRDPDLKAIRELDAFKDLMTTLCDNRHGQKNARE